RVLTDVIEQRIMPAFDAATARVKGLRGVPSEDQWRIDDALKYVTLRSQSWSLRAQGLREASSPVRAKPNASGVVAPITSGEASLQYRASFIKLGRAEAAERTALLVLERIKA